MGRSRCGGGLATSVIVWLTLRERERESVGKAFLCESGSPRAQELRFLEISRPWLWLLVEHLWCVEFVLWLKWRLWVCGQELACHGCSSFPEDLLLVSGELSQEG